MQVRICTWSGLQYCESVGEGKLVLGWNDGGYTSTALEWCMFRGVFGESTPILLSTQSNDSLREPVHLSFVVPPPHEQPHLRTAASALSEGLDLSSRSTGCSNLGSEDGETDYIVSLGSPWAFQPERGGEGWVKFRAVSLSLSRESSKCCRVFCSLAW